MRQAAKPPYERVILVCQNERPAEEASCRPRGSEAVKDALKAYVKEHNLKRRVRVTAVGCLDLCAQGVNISIQPDQVWLHDVQLTDVPEIIRRWIEPLKG